MPNPGDVKPVGKGVSELRVNNGRRYRVHFVYEAVSDRRKTFASSIANQAKIRIRALSSGTWND
ncbi:hypothetical protein E0H54_01315 [Rhizobium leguminosarum bv. viciae]|nr:hypothetical protein E0H54_01315 [Rhizobium leguminosarum bv. viciae]